jgi:hypothetical protein
MATNLVRLNVYQIDNKVMVRDAPQNIAFTTQGDFLVSDCTTSPNRSLPSGYNVYAVIQRFTNAAANQAGHFYYVAETVAQIVSLFNA